MSLTNIALLYDNTARPDTTGGYCFRAFQSLGLRVQHFLPQEVEKIPRQGIDLYVNIDDSFDWTFPRELRPMAWWAIDTHLSMERCLRRAKAADFAFAAQRDGTEEFQRQGITNAQWLPLACDPEIHGKQDVPKQYDICFIGNIFEGPRKQLLELLIQHYPNMLVDRRFMQDMARAYSQSRLVFNRSILNDINMRVYESLCASSMLVTNGLADNGQDQLFRDGTHLATYSNQTDLLDIVAFYLRNETLRERIAAAGREEVLAKHTYRHRMAAMMKSIEGMLGKVSATVPADVPTETRPSTPTPSGAGLEWIPKEAERILLIGHGDGIAEVAMKIQAARPSVRISAAIHNLTDDALANSMGDESVSGDLESVELPFTENSFDAVFIDGILERLRRPLEWLRRLRGWLKHEAGFLFKVGNARQHRLLQALIEGSWQGALPHVLNSDHLQFFTLSDVEKLCYRTGFRLELVEYTPGPDHEAWQRRGKLDEVNAGPLVISSLTPEDARQFYSSGFVLCGKAAPRPKHGMTSIVMLTWNQLPYTRLCIDSIVRHTDVPYELIIVDNGSQDGSVEYLRSLKFAKVIENPENRGFPAGVNQGIRAATGEQILLLNNDVVVTTGWLERLLAALDRDPRIGLVGPVSNFVSGEQQIPVEYDDLAQLDHFAWRWGRSHDGALVQTDRLVGFCVLIRKEVIDKVGLFDEGFGIGCFEDDDFGLRAIDQGYRLCIARDAFIHHFGHQTFIGNKVDLAGAMSHGERHFREKWANRRRPGAGTTGPNEIVKVEAKEPGSEFEKPANLFPAIRVDDGEPEPSIPLDRVPPGHFDVWVRPNGGLLLGRPGIKTSACFIARNNAKTIGPSIGSIIRIVDEVIVLDTGSTDETPEIARRLGARVFHWAWRDDFAAARNESIRHARGRWNFWMDTDDFFPQEFGGPLRQLTDEKNERIYGFVIQVMCPGKGLEGRWNITEVDHVKLFRNLPELRFRRRIHEQILESIRLNGGDILGTNLFVIHAYYDHSPEGQQRKIERDLHLLHLEEKDDPNDPFTLFNLGMTYADIAEHQKAIQYLEKSIEKATPQESHLAKAYALLVYCEEKVIGHVKAWETCTKALELFPDDFELRFRKAMLLHNSGNLEIASDAYLDILNRPVERRLSSMDRGLRSFKTRQNLAICYSSMGLVEKAEEQWRAIVDEEPGYPLGWQGFAEILCAQKKWPEAEALSNDLAGRPGMQVLALHVLGEVAESTGRPELACVVWKKVLELIPGHAEAAHRLLRLGYRP